MNGSTSNLEHIAIIMDGNNRWATAKGLSTKEGHTQGAETARNVIEYSAKAKIKYLTLYAFSSENWTRPEEEVSAIKTLLKYYLSSKSDELIKNGMKLKFIGDVMEFGKDIAKKCAEIEEKSKDNDVMSINIALNYGSRKELENAFKAIKQNSEEISQESIKSHLYTKNIPDPDLLIRTGGEKRISNFLLWQLAYTELYFTDVLWPDFDENDFKNAVEDFKRRERRFGGR